MLDQTLASASSSPVSLPLLSPKAESLPSHMDGSVNFVSQGDFPGAVEARYVRRCEEEVIVYLSSQTGCAKACRFCHLTQSGQTAAIDLPLESYWQQAQAVLGHYDGLVAAGQPRARLANFNLMARGEAFANPHLLAEGDRLLDGLAAQAVQRQLLPRFKLSTIMPQELKGVELAWVFPRHAPDIYYSLYSVDESWRKRWMPKALPAHEALGMLADYQRATRKIPVLHFALIENENASRDSMRAMAAAVRAAGLRADVNLVRYNPFSAKLGREPAEGVVLDCARALAQALPASRVQIVGRVGHDVKASCGMFVAGRGTKQVKADQIESQLALPSSASRYFGFGA